MNPTAPSHPYLHPPPPRDPSIPLQEKKVPTFPSIPSYPTEIDGGTDSSQAVLRTPSGKLPRPKSERAILSPSVPRHLQRGLTRKISSRIDPTQIPRPGSYHKETVFHTRSSSSRRNPPSVNSIYVGIDNGNCLPQHIRSTVVAPPATKESWKKMELPYSLLATPFASLSPGEEDIPQVEMEYPPRCSKCQGFVNPSVQFVEEGKKWRCSLCTTLNLVPDWYFSPLDSSRLRQDHIRRPELCKGSVDYLVGPEYRSKPCPESEKLIFAIDVSYEAYCRGITASAIKAVKKAIYQLLDQSIVLNETISASEIGLAQGSQPWFLRKDSSSEMSSQRMDYQVGLIGFSSHIHFYEINLQAKEPVKVLLAESEDPFAALPCSKWLFSLNRQLAELETFLNHCWIEIIAVEYEQPSPQQRISSACPAAVISAMAGALERSGGGRVYVFASSHSTAGLGQHSSRQRDYLYGHAEEFLMYASPPVTDMNSALASKYLLSNPSTAPLSLLRATPAPAVSHPSTPVILAASAKTSPPPPYTVPSQTSTVHGLTPWKEELCRVYEIYQGLGRDCLRANVTVSTFYFTPQSYEDKSLGPEAKCESDLTLLGEVSRITGGKLFLLSDPLSSSSSSSFSSAASASPSPPPPPLNLPGTHPPPPPLESSHDVSVVPAVPTVPTALPVVAVGLRAPSFFGNNTPPPPPDPLLLSFSSPFTVATSAVLENQLLRDLSDWVGADVVIKLRASSSVEVSEVISSGHYDSLEEVISLAGLSRSSSLLFNCRVVRDVAEEEKVHFQLAVLFTNPLRQRVLRVHNLTLFASNKGTVIFRNCDVEAVAATLAKQSSLRVLRSPLSEEKEGAKAFVQSRAVDILVFYRQLCSSVASPKGQLILPETLKTLPMYCLGMMKHPFLVDNIPLPLFSPSGQSYQFRGHSHSHSHNTGHAGQGQGNNLSSNNNYSSGYSSPMRGSRGANNNSGYSNSNSHNNNNSSSHNSRGQVLVTANERYYQVSRIISSPIRDIINSIYPRVYSLFVVIDDPFAALEENQLSSDESFDSESETGPGPGLKPSSSNSSIESMASFAGPLATPSRRSGGMSLLTDQVYCDRLKISKAINPSSENFESDQIYVVDDRRYLWLFVGRSVSQELLEEIFVLSSRYDRSERLAINQKSKLGRRAHDFLQFLAEDGPFLPELRVIWADSQSSMTSIHKFTSRLIEDANNGMMSYVDYLCNLHARMQGKF